MWTECLAGSRVTVVPSATVDRACTGCVTGTFNTASNLAACAAWTDCAVGSYVTNEPSATQDRTCRACRSGTTTDEPNLSLCMGPGCAPGTERQADTCAACPLGSYCAGGETAAIACAVGTWDHDANPATLCAAQTACVAGEFVTAPGTSTTDRGCAPCPASAYSNAPNSERCTPRLMCEDGTTAQNTPTSSTCNVCDGGTWDDDGDPETPCVAHRVCNPGQYVSVAGAAVIQQQCQACPVGTFSTTSNTGTCAAWTTCAAPAYVATAPSETANRMCGACPDVVINSRTLPTYTNADNAAACCTYPDPAAASIVANVGLDLEETVQLVGCIGTDGCALLNALPAIETHTIDVFPNITEAQCASTYSYRWQLRYPLTFNSGQIYTSRGITGDDTSRLTIRPQFAARHWGGELAHTPHDHKHDDRRHPGAALPFSIRRQHPHDSLGDSVPITDTPRERLPRERPAAAPLIRIQSRAPYARLLAKSSGRAL